MKRKNVDFVAVIVLALGFTLGSASLAEKFYAAKFMNASEAKQKWGVLTPNAVKFKKSSEKEKGAMSANVIDRKLFVGQDMLSIREQFGDPDSYFFSDTIYAYMISANVKPK